MQKLIFTLLILSLLSCSQAGHIYSYDPCITFENAGYATTWQFFFSLESGLGAGKFINLNMGSATLLGSPADVIASATNGLTTKYAATIYNYGTTTAVGVTTTAVSSAVYSFSNTVALSANTWYTLQLTAVTTNQAAGLYDPIVMYTSSLTHGSSNLITYDINNVFAVVSLMSAPSTTLVGTVSYPTGQTTLTKYSTANTMYVDITPKPGKDIPTGAFYKIALESSTGCDKFTFTGSCSADQNVCAASATSCTNITLLSNSVCTVAKDKTNVLFENKGVLKHNTIFRVKLEVTNPDHYPSTTQACKFVITEYSRNSQKLIYEMNTAGGVASSLGYAVAVTRLALGQTTVSYFWGLSPVTSGQTDGTCNRGFFTSRITRPIFTPIQLGIVVSTAPPATVEIKAKIAVTLTAGVIQEGTIVTDFPSYTGKTVSCEYTSKFIECHNIGALSTKTYKVSFRAYQTAVASGSETAHAAGITQLYSTHYTTAVPAQVSYNELTTASLGVSMQGTIAEDQLVGANSLFVTGAVSATAVEWRVRPTVFSLPAAFTKCDNYGTSGTGQAACDTALLYGIGGIQYDVVGDSTQAVYFLLSVDTTLICGAANTASPCSKAVNTTANVNTAVLSFLISIMANHNLLDITTSAKKLIGILPSYGVRTSAKYITVATAAQTVGMMTSPQVTPAAGTYYQRNEWTKKTGTNEGFWLLVATCRGNTNITANDQYCPYWLPADSGKSQGFQMKNFKQLSTIRTSISGDSSNFDFIMCWRKGHFKNAGDSTGTEPANGDLAWNAKDLATWGSSIQVHYVYQTWSYNAFTSGSDFYASIVNWFGKCNTGCSGHDTQAKLFQDATTASKVYQPLMIRLCFKFATADTTGASGVLGLFFDASPHKDKNVDNKQYRSIKSRPSSIPVASTITATAKAYNMATFDGTGLDFTNNQWHIQELNRVDLTMTLATTYTNVYVPISYGTMLTNKEAGGPILNIHVMTGKTDSTSGAFIPVKTFNLVGYQNVDSSTSSAITSSACKKLVDKQLGGHTNGYTNVFNVAAATCTPAGTVAPVGVLARVGSTVTTLSVKSGLTINPGKAVSGGLLFTTQTTSGSYSYNTYANRQTAGAHYIVSYFGTDIYTDVTSYSSGSSAKPKFTQNCVKFVYSYPTPASFGGTAPIHTNTLLICANDESAYSAGSQISLPGFKAPTDWGSSTSTLALFKFSCTELYGNVQLVQGSVDRTITASPCTVVASTPIYLVGQNNQKINISFSNTVAMTTATNGNIVVFVDFYSASDYTTAKTAPTAGTITGCEDVTIGTTVYTCTNSANTFTLVPALAANRVVTTIAASVSINIPITISFSNPASPVTDTYGVNVAASGTNYITKCTSNTPTNYQKLFGGSTAAYDQSLKILTSPTFTYTKTKSARDDISLTFTTANSKPLYKNEIFEFDLGYLSTPLSTYNTAGAMRCVVQNILGNMDFNWQTIELTSLSAVKLTPFNQLAQTNWKLKCYGGAAPDGSSTTKLKYYVKQSSTVVQTSEGTSPVTSISIPWTQNTLPSAASATPFVLKNKTLNSPGIEADYNFSITPKVATVTSLSGKVYISFPYAIAPRLNRDGVVTCQMNYTPAYCDFYSERFVRVWPTKDMTLNQETQVGIFHVAQPPTLSASTSVKSQIFLALDLDADYANGVSEFGEIADTEAKATADTTNALTAMQLNNYVSTSLITRNSGDHQFSMVVPSGKIVAGTVFIVTFPASFDDFNQKTTLTCSLIREGDTTSTNYGATSCSILNGRKARLLVVTTDAENAAASVVYTLTVSGVTTPSHPVDNLFPTVMILASYTTYKASVRTVGTRVNATAPKYAHPAGMIVANWKYNVGRTSLDVFKGYFSSNSVATLVRKDGQNFNFIFSFVAADGSGFKTLPAGAQNTTRGMSATTFRLSSLSSQVAGAFVVRWTKSGDPKNIYTPLPPLFVHVREDKCQVNANLASLDIPIGGYSLPVTFDFKPCIPVTSVSLSLNLTQAAKQNTQESSLSFINGNGTSFTVSKTLLGSNELATRLVFRIKHTSSTTQTTAASSYAKAYTTVGGVDGSSYLAPNVISINRVLAPTTKPTAKAFTASSVAGSATLSMTCDQPGMALWVASVKDFNNANKNGHATVDAAFIIKNSVDLGQQISVVDEYKNPSWLVYGYAEVFNANTAVSSTLNRVKANANYTASFWCINQVNNVSDLAKTVDWKQTDNGAKIVVITLTTAAKQNNAEQNKIIAVLNFLLNVRCERTISEFGLNSCSQTTFRMLQTTNTTNTTNTNSTSVPTSYDFRVTVLPQYWGALDNTDANAKALTAARINTGLTTGKRILATTNTVQSLSVKSYPTTTAAVPPTLTTTTPVPAITKNTISITLTISNQEGYIYAGAADMTATRPSITQLKQGVVGNGTAMTSNYTYVKMNTAGTLVLSGLKERTLYQLFFGASTVDTSNQGAFTPVYSLNVSTSSSFIGLSGNVLNIALVSMIGMIAALFMLN